MEFDSLIKIFGLIATITFGLVRIFQINRNQNRTEITFIKNAIIPMFRNIISKIDKLAITYENKKIGENIILFKGTFLNTGNTDIDKSRVYTPLEMELNDDLNWIEFKISNCSEGLEIVPSQENKKITLGWELFKEAEYFTFDSMIECNSLAVTNELNRGGSLAKYLKFNQRISGLKIVSEDGNVKPMGNTILTISLTALLSFATFFSYFAFDLLFTPKIEILKQEQIDGKLYYLKIIDDHKSEVEFYDSTGTKLGEVKAESSQRLGGKLKTINKGIDYGAAIFCALATIFIVYLMASTVRREIKSRKFNKLLKDTGSINL